MATLGKALGGYGAFVCGENDVVEWMIQRARAYIYSTALPPMAAAVASASVDILESDPAPLANVHARIARLRERCAAAGIELMPSSTPIQPIVVGNAAGALAASARLREHGLLVPAIRPPTVPAGTSRLRISLSAAHTEPDVDALARALIDTLA
jgi:8-amino-7-oxononanoate synthase